MHSNFAERSSRNYININFLYASDTEGGAWVVGCAEMLSNFAERSSRNYFDINFLYASDTKGGAWVVGCAEMLSNFAERSSRNYFDINFLYASDTEGGALPGLFCLTSASDGSPCEAADRKAESLRTVSVSEGRT